jgi:hypothetical protein
MMCYLGGYLASKRGRPVNRFIIVLIIVGIYCYKESGMAKAEIAAGICGFVTRVEAHMEGKQCALQIESTCPSIQKMAGELQQVNPFNEISYRKGIPATLDAATHFCPHPACPVPVGILKAVEVASGLALPADVSIKVSKE